MRYRSYNENGGRAERSCTRDGFTSDLTDGTDGALGTIYMVL